MNQTGESIYFKRFDLIPIKFKIDTMEYSFDNKYMLWKSLSLTPAVKNEPIDTQNKSKTQKITLDQKAIFDQNEEELRQLQKKVEAYEESIEKHREELEQAKVAQEKLINEYIIEHLETEKVKNARERLDKLKKELGI